MKLSNFFNDIPLYTKEKFEIFILAEDKKNYLLDENELNRFINFLGLNQNKIITYCHKCKKEFPFNISKSLMTDESPYDLILTDFNFNSMDNRVKFISLNINTGYLDNELSTITKDLLVNKTDYIYYECKCTNDESHKYMMLASIISCDGVFTVTKVGQNPSMLTIKGFDFDVYKKQLSDFNAYEDYKKADLCNANQYYVGAYAYLRRIFEKMVLKFCEGVPLKDNHIDTKIEATKDQFDPRIRDMLVNLYDILSKSIHELDEDVGKQYYEYLKAVIEMQLEFLKTEYEKNKQTKKLESTLNKIKSSFSLKGK